MIIDRKQEEMLSRCRRRKHELDRNIAAVRVFLLFPAIFYCAFIIIWIIASILSDALILATGAGWWGFKAKGSSISNLFAIIECLWLIYLGASLSIWRTKNIMEKKLGLYLGTFFAGMLIILIFRSLSVIVPPIIAIFAIPFLYINERLVREDEAMSNIEGYPHFNPTLMINRRIPTQKVSKETIDNMTPDERIEFERSAYNHRNQY